jgi:hypothetical protein
MLKRIYKTIVQENGKITIYGSNRDIKTYYKKPEWNDEEEELCFKYRGREYFFSEFMNIHNKVYGNYPDYLQEFNGIMNDSYFSGILIKISEDSETVKAYTFIS